MLGCRIGGTDNSLVLDSSPLVLSLAVFLVFSVWLLLNYFLYLTYLKPTFSFPLFLRCDRVFRCILIKTVYSLYVTLCSS